MTDGGAEGEADAHAPSMAASRTVRGGKEMIMRDVSASWPRMILVHFSERGFPRDKGHGEAHEQSKEARSAEADA